MLRRRPGYRPRTRRGVRERLAHATATGVTVADDPGAYAEAISAA